MKEKTALVFGATGLIGSHLLNLLQYDDRYGKIITFSRRPISLKHPKIENHVLDLLDYDKYNQLVKGDDLFCCIGTTIKKAGSKDAFRKVDFEFPAKIAEIAYRNGVLNFIVISSIGAKASSKIFYLRAKGEMEEAVKKYPFNKIRILRPSILFGIREEFRLMEMIGKIFARSFGFLFTTRRFKRFRGIHAETVALCMINVANNTTSHTIFESEEIAMFAGCK